MTQLGRLSLLLRKAEREDRFMLLAKEGGGRSLTSRRLAIAPPDAFSIDRAARRRRRGTKPDVPATCHRAARCQPSIKAAAGDGGGMSTTSRPMEADFALLLSGSLIRGLHDPAGSTSSSTEEAEHDLGRCTVHDEDGGGQSRASRRLAIAPPDDSQRSKLPPLTAGDEA